LIESTEHRTLDQDEFGTIAYVVMGHAFAIHEKMGRFFDEDIYRDALAARTRINEGDALENEIPLLGSLHRRDDLVESFIGTRSPGHPSA
jgi:hypothetical protein